MPKAQMSISKLIGEFLKISGAQYKGVPPNFLFFSFLVEHPKSQSFAVP